MDEPVVVSGVANDRSSEPEAQKQAAQAQNGRQEHQRPTQGLRTADRHGVGCRREQRQVGHRRRQAQLEQGFSPPDVARLANAELHQTCYSVFHHLASPSSFTERRTGLQFARLLEQSFLPVDLHRPPALTPRALRPQWARRTRLGGKHEHPTSTLSGSQVTRLLLGWAGARARLQIDLKVGLGEERLIVDLGDLGEYRPSTRREFRARAARAIGAVANHLHYFTVRRYFGSLDHLQRSVRVGCIAWQHLHRGDQLRVGVDGDLRLVPIEPMAATFAPVPHLRVVHRDQPIRRHALFQPWPVLITLEVLGQDAGQHPSSSDQFLVICAVLRQPSSRPTHQLLQLLGIGHNLGQEPLPSLRVRPVHFRLAFQTRPLHVPRTANLFSHVQQLKRSQLGQHVQHLDDAIRQQVVSILDRSTSQDVRRIQRQLHLLPLMRRVAFLPHPAPLGHLQTLLEDGTGLCVQDQLRSKLLQRAFRKRSHVQLDSQCYLPLQVEGGPTSGFVIRNPVIRLQHQRGGQQARRHTRPPVVATVECGEVFVTEQLIPLRGEKPVEVLPANEVPVQRVRLKHAPLRRPLTEHSAYAPCRSDLLRLPYLNSQADRKSLTPFRPRF